MSTLRSTSTLYVGEPGASAAHIERELQKVFCPQKGCQLCTICIQIHQRKYASLVWLVSPQKTYYTRAELDDVVEATRFARSEQEPFFCVVEEVDRLHASTAASLLKIIEEPPVGLYWFFTAQRVHDVLPTVVSRSVVVPLGATPSHEHDELFTFFTSAHKHSYAECQGLLDRHKLNEYESRMVFDKLFAYWVNRFEQQGDCLKVVTWYQGMSARYPMPGSAKLFWRTVYLATVTHMRA